MELIIIAAMAANRVIGCNNALPWHIPEESAHFKQTTLGHTLIMGRRTYLSIGSPLPGRRNIVVSATPNFHPPVGCELVSSLDQAIDLCRGDEKVFIIGGEQLYRAALPMAHTLILTLIPGEFAGDTWFPDFSSLPFELVERRKLAAQPPLTILTYRQRQPQTAAAPGMLS